MNIRHFRSARERGMTLVVVLVLLIAAVFLGVSAAVVALQTEKAARGERDRQIAFQAAEAALIDAQQDIETASASVAGHRALDMGPDSALGFPPIDQPTFGQGKQCNAEDDRVGFGLCRRSLPAAPGTAANSWPASDLSDERYSVPYGRYTNQQFPIGLDRLPAKRPRYVIELMPFVQPGGNVQTQSFAYRITAIGFGTSADTQVVLQAFYRKEQ